MLLTLTLAHRHKGLQADVPVDHFEPSIGPEPGTEYVAEWRFRAALDDPWSSPVVRIFAGTESTYTTPGDGYVQLVLYSRRGGLESWQRYLREFRVFGDDILQPREVGDYVDQDDNNYADQDGNHYEG